MGRVKAIRIEGYRSIRDRVTVGFPDGVPVVLLGENNAGKSNIVRALDLVLGEFWPGSHEPDDHEFFGRSKGDGQIDIYVDLEGVQYIDWRMNVFEVRQLRWRHPCDGDRPLSMVLDNGAESPYVSNDVRGQCPCIVVGADRRLSYQMSYSSRYTFLAKLMRQFHDALTSDEARILDLQQKFAEIKSLFVGVPEFAAFEQDLRDQVAELSENLAYGLEIDFSAYDPSNYFHALRVYPKEKTEVRTFDELGTGQEQILAICFAHAYAKAFHQKDGQKGGLLLVIEEPEAHLHPLAQRWLARKVEDLAKTGIQVLVTTHSPAFLNVLNLEGFVLVRKENGVTRAKQLTRKKLADYCSAHGATTTPDTILPFYAAAATEEILAGLFARKVVLVEGPTEAMALPVYLGRLGLSVTREGVAVIPVHGVGNVAKWWRFFTAYGIPTYVVFDNDASKAKEDPKGTRRKDILTALGIAEDAHDSLISARDWRVEDELCVFGDNFEETLRVCFGSEYRDLEAEAQQKFGLSPNQSKPLVARYVAERLDLDSSTDGKRRLQMLADRIRALEASGQHMRRPEDAKPA